MDLMNAVINAANAQAAYDQQQTMNMILSVGIGLCGGLTVAFLGLAKRQGWIGAIGLLVCLVGGFFGGWLLVIPLTGGLSAVINEQAKRRDAQEFAVQQQAEQWNRDTNARRQIEQNARIQTEASARQAEAERRAQAQLIRTVRTADRALQAGTRRITSQIAAARWSDRLNAPQVTLEDLTDGVMITVTPSMELYRGAYAERAALLGETPLKITADGSRHLLSGYIGGLWAASITIDAAESPAPQPQVPVKANQTTSKVAAARWSDRLNDPRVQLENLPDGVHIVITPPVTLYRGAYAERSALLGETPLTLSVSSGCHLLSGFIGDVWAASITIDVAESTAPQPQVPVKANGGNTDHSLIAGLERLATLRSSGTLTDDEFTAAKAVLLNGSSTPA